MAIKKKEEKMDIRVTRVKDWENGRISFDAEVNGVTIYGMTHVTSDKGDFISFPARKTDKDGKYYNHVYCKFDKEALEDIENQISSML